MINRKTFFNAIRPMFPQGKLTAGQVAGITAILDHWECDSPGLDPRWVAYMLATTHHETDRTMAPIEEYGKGKGKPYGRRVKLTGRIYADTANVFYGRGFVQLTWYENYQKAGAKLGLDLINEPDQAMKLTVATRILFAGMIEGWFTGKKLSNYFDIRTEDWVNARRIINGTDKANDIAKIGKQYATALRSALLQSANRTFAVT